MKGSSVDWQLCLFCQKSKCKGSKQLINLCTRKAEESLRKAVDILNDDANEDENCVARFNCTGSEAVNFRPKAKKKLSMRKLLLHLLAISKKAVARVQSNRDEAVIGSVSDSFNIGRSGIRC